MNNKRLFFLFITLLLSFSMMAQKTQTVKKSHRTPYSYKEEFEVLKENKKIKHGYYKKYVNGELSLAGSYEHGKKVEVWQSFKRRGQIYYSYNHSTEKLIFFKEYEDIYKDEGLDNPPIIEEGESAFLVLLYSNLKYPTFAREKGVDGAVFVRLIISKEGDIKQSIIDNSDSELLDPAALQAIEDIKPYVKFLPARKNGEKVESFFLVPIRFRLS